MQPNITYTFEGRFTPQDKTTSDYHYFPFEVPEGITRLDISFDYSQPGHRARKAGHENAIDIGLFDAQGHAFNGAGFRGWSGSARATFFVGLTEATPGYLPGPILAGTWQVVLGLYKIAPDGCDYKINVILNRSSQPAQPAYRPATLPFQPGSVVRAGAGWYAGDLQTHSYHSDAEGSVARLADVARARGLDFVAITDHNTVSQLAELATHTGLDLLVIPAMEVTTYYGHANVWGLNHWLDFRCSEAGHMRRIMEAAHTQEALFSINHPNSTCNWEYGWIEGTDAIEVWNGLWNRANYRSLSWWDELLQVGWRIAAVGGSDRHQPHDFDPYFPHQVGTPTTWVYAENLSVAAILAGIRAGHVFITADVTGPQLHLTARAAGSQTVLMGDTLSVPPGTPVTFECEVNGARGNVLELIQGGQVIARHSLEDETIRVTRVAPVEGHGYLRAQIIASDSATTYPRVLALTNPIYIRQG